MARDGIPITAAVLTWARDRSGYSVEELAPQFKQLAEWESGSSLPSYPQLEMLADKLKIPVAVLFFPEPPKTPPIRQSFRTLSEEDFRDMPHRIRFLLRKAKAFQLNLAELNGGDNPAERLITRDLRFTLKASVKDMARQVRNFLGISLDEQQAWTTDDIALESWRDAVTKCGIFVFKDAFRAEDYSGFCLYDDAFPIIYVNNTSAKTRQMFTILHELAHLLYGTSGIDTFSEDYIDGLRPDAQRIEITCNRFAAEFLLPDEAVKSALEGKAPTEETAQHIARSFHVSREMVFRRFLDWGLVQQADYVEASRRWAAQRKSGSGGDYYNTQIAYLGKRYIDLAFRRYHQNRIDGAQLAEYLGMAPRYVPVLEDRFAGRTL